MVEKIDKNGDWEPALKKILTEDQSVSSRPDLVHLNAEIEKESWFKRLIKIIKTQFKRK